VHLKKFEMHVDRLVVNARGKTKGKGTYQLDGPNVFDSILLVLARRQFCFINSWLPVAKFVLFGLPQNVRCQCRSGPRDIEYVVHCKSTDINNFSKFKMQY